MVMDNLPDNPAHNEESYACLAVMPLQTGYFVGD